MAKGLFTQGMCVLLRRPLSVARIEHLLRQFHFVGRHESMDDSDSPQTLVYQFDAKADGHLLVTLSDSPWPDDMGDPDETPERFVAWSLGQFAPLAFPGCLARASEQSWGWEDSNKTVDKHRAHVRLLISYVLGSEEEDDEQDDSDLPLMPDDYDVLGELTFLTKAVTAVLDCDEAICYFNPGGEVLRDEDALRRGLNDAWQNDVPPLDMWANVRLFRAVDDWALMDTVGNRQLDIPDLEAIYPSGDFEVKEVESFLRATSLYMVRDDGEFEEGFQTEGPGEVLWEAMECFDGLSDPPRETIRWFPLNGTRPPEELLYRGQTEEELHDFDSSELDFEDFEDGLDEELGG